MDFEVIASGLQFPEGPIVMPDGSVWMTTYRKSQKAVNVARNPKVALHIESGNTYDTLRGVCIRGNAEIVAVSNNFLWNRHWTFKAGDGQAHRQAVRFLLVSVVAFGVGLALLTVLVELAGMQEVPAQAVAIVAVTPLSFLANKLWSFSR